jgi:hypothetical protein
MPSFASAPDLGAGIQYPGDVCEWPAGFL